MSVVQTVKYQNGKFKLKYAITGHSYGIGEALYNRLDSIGFSKSTGHDIHDSNIRKQIIEASSDCDVFINNAPAGFAQSHLLLELWHAWRDTDKTIINVGSRIAQPEFDLPMEYNHLLRYQMHKRTLKQLSETLSALDTPLTVKYRWFAYVGTPKILAKYPHFTENDYISIDEAVEIILE